MEEGEPPSEILTKTQGSRSPFEISAMQEGESMDYTLVIDIQGREQQPLQTIEMF